MTKKERIKTHLIKHKVVYTLLLVFVVVLISRIIYNQSLFGDDYNYYLHFPDQFESIIDFLSFRYKNWTCRLSVEFVMFAFIKHRYLFAVLDSLIYVLIVYSIYLLFDKRSIILSLIGACMIPFYYYTKDVGYYAGSTNYAWPIAFLLLGLVFIKKIICGNKLKFYEIIILLLSFVFSSFVEICAVLLLICMSVAEIVYIKKHRKFSFIIAISAVISSLGIIFMLLSPGNTNRANLEIINYFPEYQSYNIIQKLSYGLIFVNNATCLIPTLSYFTLYALLIYLSFKNKKDLITKICSMMPIITLVAFYIIYILLGIINHNLNFEFLYKSNGLTFSKPITYVLIAIAIINNLSIIISIFKNFNANEKIFYMIFYVVSIGIVGSFGLVGSVSFYADYRPVIFSGVIISIIVQQIIYSQNNLKKIKAGE